MKRQCDVGLGTASHRHSANRSCSSTRLRRPVMGAFMKDPSLGSKAILSPLPLQMNKRKLPLAENQMLERRDREEVGCGRHSAEWVHHLDFAETLPVTEVFRVNDGATHLGCGGEDQRVPMRDPVASMQALRR